MTTEKDGVALYSTEHPVRRWPPLWFLHLTWWWRMQCAWNPWKKWHYAEIEIKEGKMIPLVITLKCPHCAHVWTTDYEPGDIITRQSVGCPKCAKLVCKDQYVNKSR